MLFTTVYGDELKIDAGTRLVIGWTRNGDAPAGTVHDTETVTAIVVDQNGLPDSLILTGGQYKNGADFRVLALFVGKKKSDPTRQIAGAFGQTHFWVE